MTPSKYEAVSCSAILHLSQRQADIPSTPGYLSEHREAGMLMWPGWNMLTAIAPSQRQSGSLSGVRACCCQAGPPAECLLYVSSLMTESQMKGVLQFAEGPACFVNPLLAALLSVTHCVRWHAPCLATSNCVRPASSSLTAFRMLHLGLELIPGQKEQCMKPVLHV